MKRLLLLGFALTIAFSSSFAQIPLVSQSFEGAESWAYTASPEFYNFNNGDAFGIIDGEYQDMAASSGTHFVALHDLANPNVVEGETSSYYHHITFETVMIPQPAPEDLKLSFKYNVTGFDYNDFLAYEVQFDFSDSWYSDWTSNVDTSYEFSQYLSKETDDQWILHTIDLPDTVSAVRFRIGGFQNGGSDWAGLDEFSLFFDSEADFQAPNALEATIINDQQILVTFDEPLLEGSVSLVDYSVSSAEFNSDNTQLTINLSSSLADGDIFTLFVDTAIDYSGNLGSSTFELVHNDFVGSLVISEINYDDPGQYNNLSFFEIYNNGDEAYPLGGLAFTEGISVNFTEYLLEPGEYVIIAKPAFFLNDECGSLTYGCGFQSYFGFAPDFEISSGYLSTSGENLVCLNTIGEEVINFTYDDTNGWPEIPSGTAYSINLCDPTSDMNNPENWSLSSSFQAAIDPSDSVLVPMGVGGFTQYYADPGGSCPGEQAIEGCTDPTACNYDESIGATSDDGSCILPNDCGSCDDDLSCLVSVTVSVDMTIEGFDPTDGINYDGLDGTTMAVRLDGGDWHAMSENDGVWSYVFMVFPNATYSYNFNDGVGNGYESGDNLENCAEGTYVNNRTFTVDSLDLFIPTVCWESCEACPDVVPGCMDSTASNYNFAATEDDGSCTYAAPMQNLFFSEYAEGSSNNKYLEIYNASDVTVSLADYGYPNVSNAPSTVGEYEYWNSFDEGAEIAPNGVYIVAHGSSDPLILALANETHNYLSNGDDGYALAYGTSDDYVIIDHIGDFNGDPGTAWDVAGVSNATKDHTLVRKCSVESGNTDWVASAGTDADDSEWIVLEQDDWSDLGMHTSECPTVVLGCTDSTANNYNALATEDDGSCDYTVISYYSLTVSVDMSVEGFVAGDGSTWDGLDGSSMAIRLDGGSWVAMTDMGDNVWSHTFTDLVAGDYTYNFNDGWYESGPFGDCVGGQYGNDRLATIVDMDVTVPTVCWESCEACPEVVLGCTDETASNYDAAATEDDGSCTYAAPMQNLFFSEYAEGSSNNKYLEIYNASDVTVSLADYGYPNVSNAPSTVGEYEYWNSFDEGAEIAPNGVYIVAHGSSDPLILALANETHNYLSNGDDGYALAYGTSDDYVIIDHIGDFNGDPGTAWDVAGVSNATKDHTLVRKCSVESGNTDWVASAGTDADDSEWIVLEQDDWSDLGMHTSECPTVVLGCTDSTANNYNALATEDDGSCDYTVISYYSLTVSVDMSVEGFVAGDGSTWDGLDGSSMAIRLDGGSWVAMTDMGDNVWSHTFTDLVAGDYTYNFNDGWYESGPFGDCVGGQYGNDRLATIVDMDVTVPTVCWESCEACPEVVLGCTDETASNYDAAATEDDGSCTYAAPMQNLFFSEYAEGSSNNKYLEIYNASDVTVSLADYGYPNVSNAPSTVGEYEYWNSFDEGAEIAPNGVYIVAHGSSDPLILALANETHNYLSNGDDGYALAYGTSDDYVIIDHIGDFNGDPGTAWDVAGVSNATKDHTLVRKCSVESGNTDWVASAGTDADDSEWIVLEQDDWSDLGMHTSECPTVVLGCTDSTANNYNALATEDDGSCDYTVISYYSLTVSVDMSVEGFVAGDGSTWDGLDGSSMAIRLDGGSWVAMTDMGDNVWSHTFTDLVAGDYTYNFNDGWYESGPFGDCVGGQYGNDRLATIVDMDVTVPTVCWESCEACPEVVLGCTDETASNYDAAATEDDGSCTYAAPMQNLFFSEYAEGSSNNKYLEIYNASDVTVSLADYGYPNVSNAPSTVGEYEYWNSFDEGAEIAPNGVYIVAHGSSDSLILALANETHNYLSNGDDGYALAYGTSDDYVIIDHIGDFNGDPGTAWDVAGVSNATKDHTLVRKCSVESGNTDWVASAGTDADDSEWIVLEQDDWSDLGMHTSECPTPLILVNFTVDMSTTSQPNMIDYDNVVINGTWNGWQGWGVTLSDEDGDNIWTGSGEFDPAIGQFEYVVAVTGPTDGYSGWGMQWGNCDGSNFIVVFEEGVTSYDATPDLDCPEPTVFNVDMSCSGIEFTTVHLTGPIWGWTTDIIMTDEDGDGIYSITMDGLEGDVEYKYMVDYWAGQEDLIDDMVNGATCAPITDYSSYANRQVAAGTTTSDTYGSCDECGSVITGCTDEAASNYNPAATEDDGSCDYCDDVTVNFSVDASEWIGVVIGYQNVVINGSFANWNGWGVELTDADGDGIWTGSTTVDANVTHEYVHALTGTADWYSGWGIIGYAPEACQLGISETTGDASPNYYFSGECGEVIDLPTVCFGSCVGCIDEVLGCTDASADNYDPNANTDDGSCTYCNSFEVVVIGTSDASAAGASDGSVQATGQGGSNDYSVSVVDGNGVPQNSFALAAGDYTVTVTDVTSGCEASTSVTISEPTVAEDPCDIVPTGLFVDDIIHNRVVFNWSAPSAAPSHYMIRYREVGTSSWTVMTAGPVNSNEFTGTSRTRYFMEPGTTYEWNIRARVLNEDGSTNCQSAWSTSNEYTTLDACANLENLSVSTEAVWATLSADAPAAEWGVWQSKGKMRVVGTNSFRYVNGDENGNISTLKGNFTASTDYEWHTKAWCTGNVDSEGNSDPMYHSGWGDFSSFTTEAPCDKMPTNLSTSANGAQTAITMSWDTPESGEPDHYFLELTNVTTGQVWAWNNISGSDNSKTKFGLTAGDYSWRIRGACGTNGTSWATIFSQPVTYTLGGARLENSSVANLDVYPNPSRDIFNVTFTSEEAQTMTVKVVNMIGEEIFIEELTEFVGQYTQVIDMNTQPKGVYFLEITTSTGGINKKIVLQ